MRSASLAYRRRSKGEGGRIPTARWGLKEAWSKRAKGPSERVGAREMNLRGDGRQNVRPQPDLRSRPTLKLDRRERSSYFARRE
jgi:hypothetical protein